MNKYFWGFFTALFLVCTVAFMRQQSNGILITGGFGGEPKLQANQPDQTAPWILFNNFQLPATGIVPAANLPPLSGLSGVAAQATHATNADLATLATTAITSTNVQGYSLMTNNLVAVALVEQTNALGYVTNTYLTYTTNAFHYLGR